MFSNNVPSPIALLLAKQTAKPFNYWNIWLNTAKIKK